MKLRLGCAALALALVCWIGWHAVSPTTSPISTPSPTPAVARQTTLAPTPPTSISSPTAPALLQGDAARNLINDAWAEYDPAQVPVLSRYLAHPDPEIRAAAREGLVQLGEPAGIPVLEAAARNATDPEESHALRKAAEFLALPAWSGDIHKTSATPASHPVEASSLSNPR